MLRPGQQDLRMVLATRSNGTGRIGADPEPANNDGNAPLNPLLNALPMGHGSVEPSKTLPGSDLDAFAAVSANEGSAVRIT